jgi:hypothetical protein
VSYAEKIESLVAERDTLRAENAGLRERLAALLIYAERVTCQHDETHRGGAIWTICDGCGMRWSDDRNPFKGYTESAEITRAREFLDKAPQPATAPASAPAQSEREAFEAWCPYQGSPDPWTVWQAAWQARAALPAADRVQPEAPAPAQPVYLDESGAGGVISHDEHMRQMNELYAKMRAKPDPLAWWRFERVPGDKIIVFMPHDSPEGRGSVLCWRGGTIAETVLYHLASALIGGAK